MPYRVHTRYLTVSHHQANEKAYRDATDILKSGGLVAFPTETVYGLGAHALDAEAVGRIFEAKERPNTDPIIVHIHDIAQLNHLARDIPQLAYDLADRFWPGALTLILHRHANVPNIITAGQETVAIRMPSHPIARALLQTSNLPIGAPSANRFSRPSPTTAEHVRVDLDGRVDLILDGGATDIGVESTIIDLTQHIPTVLRPGGVALEALQAFVNPLQFKPRFLPEDGQAVPAPGNLIKHYSPDADVLVYDGDYETVHEVIRLATKGYLQAGRKVGLLLMDADIPLYDALSGVVIATLGQDNDAMAENLFAGLRDLDSTGVSVILVRAPDEIGLGLAIRDRLIRAGEGKIIRV